VHESPRHQEAFNYYVTLPKRSYRLVAEKYSVSEVSVKKWAREFNWRERIEIRDAEVNKKMEEKVDDTLVKVKADYHKIIKALIGKAVEKIKAGGLEAENVQDIERLIKTDLQLLGETLDGQPVNVGVILIPERDQDNGKQRKEAKVKDATATP
jgi:hypothetical protein